jgi:uncharacterized protein YeaO (DUF488 family)
MPVRTKRWNDPRRDDDGFRLLICRLRPRGVSKADETWDDWWQDLGPTRDLLDAFHGKHGPPLDWDRYAARYLDEMRGPAATWMIRDLGRRYLDGETITLLCSSACTNPERCHRTLLAGLISTHSATDPGRDASKHRAVSPSTRSRASTRPHR